MYFSSFALIVNCGYCNFDVLVGVVSVCVVVTDVMVMAVVVAAVAVAIVVVVVVVVVVVITSMNNLREVFGKLSRL